MKRILSAKEMKEADMAAIEGGISALVLMERAALATVREIHDAGYDLSKVFVLCGPGNNGGDGIAAARLLAEEGYSPQVCIFGKPEKYSEEMKAQLKALSLYDVKRAEAYVPDSYTLVIDALFGIGLKRNITGEAAEIIELINSDGVPVVAVDIPSGINTDTGAVMGTAVKADLTVAFERAKTGHCLYPGAKYTGRLAVRHIGIPIKDAGDKACIRHVEDEDLMLLPERKQDSNKSTFGKVLILAGSKDICGAAYFAAASALRCGAGMVRIFTHINNRTSLNVLLPEALIDVYDENDLNFADLEKAVKWSDIVIAGCGLGTGIESHKLLEYFIDINDRPAVLDADALNILSKDEKLLKSIDFESVVTPHIGEMGRLCKKTAAQVKSDILNIASDFSRKYNTVCVLKDSKTVIAYPDGTCYINLSGCSALATAGSGDVLTGVLAAIKLRCKAASFPSEALAVHFHGRLGEKAAESKGEGAVIASDLIAHIR